MWPQSWQASCVGECRNLQWHTDSCPYTSYVKWWFLVSKWASDWVQRCKLGSALSKSLVATWTMAEEDNTYCESRHAVKDHSYQDYMRECLLLRFRWLKCSDCKHTRPRPCPRYGTNSLNIQVLLGNFSHSLKLTSHLLVARHTLQPIKVRHVEGPVPWKEPQVNCICIYNRCTNHIH